VNNLNSGAENFSHIRRQVTRGLLYRPWLIPAYQQRCSGVNSNLGLSTQKQDLKKYNDFGCASHDHSSFKRSGLPTPSETWISILEILGLGRNLQAEVEAFAGGVYIAPLGMHTVKEGGGH
jgi:hypothetical protein